jgi:hypothetical protein
VKHATAATLDRLEPLLERIRACAVLREKSRGIFYLKSRAYLHFHEDPKGLFVDIRAADGRDLDRFRVDDGAGANEVLARVAALVGGAA